MGSSAFHVFPYLQKSLRPDPRGLCQHDNADADDNYDYGGCNGTRM